MSGQRTHAELEDIGIRKVGRYASLDTTGNIPAEQLGNVEGMEEHGNEWHNPALLPKLSLMRIWQIMCYKCLTE